ncbi:MAG: type I restriction enzyme HsdR N-terminal domain-containing protein [Dehalococcoidales bacterium]|nr:type I restriction enzyme HsdR N-terminal domain-containing protein [Dehalococcoidales bacterium]
MDKNTRKSLTEARELIDGIVKIDANEAETRRRVEHLFHFLMGYDEFKHLTREYTVENPGDTDYCDFAIVLEETKHPAALIEIKRVTTELAPKHIKQAAGYAINAGCEWVILTNGQHWQLFHITFGKPPETTLLEQWNLMTDDFQDLAGKFEIIGYKNLKKGGLGQLWLKSSVLIPHNVLKIILSENSISSIRRELKRTTDVSVTPEEIVGAVRRLLNESAISELGNIKVSLPSKASKKSKPPVPISSTQTIPPAIESN